MCSDPCVCFRKATEIGVYQTDSWLLLNLQQLFMRNSLDSSAPTDCKNQMASEVSFSVSSVCYLIFFRKPFSFVLVSPRTFQIIMNPVDTKTLPKCPNCQELSEKLTALENTVNNIQRALNFELMGFRLFMMAQRQATVRINNLIEEVTHKVDVDGRVLDIVLEMLARMEIVED